MISREVVKTNVELLEGQLQRDGHRLLYNGYEVRLVDPDSEDVTPAFYDRDGKTHKAYIVVLKNLPPNLFIPLLEHEIYEIENGGRRNHKKAVQAARKKAEELGVLEEFIKFEEKWEKIKKY